MKITVLCHNLSSNAVMRAHRLAVAARQFAEVVLLGPVELSGLWPALPAEPWIQTVEDRRLPKFYRSFLKLVEEADGDVLIAVKPQFASFGSALIAGERRGAPVILDLDDWDAAFTPRSRWAEDPLLADPRRPGSAVYVSLLTKATGAAAAITVSCRALQKKFGGVLLPHGAMTELFDPAGIDRAAARKEFGLDGPTVLFPGTPRLHKGIRLLAEAVGRIPGARLAVTCRPEDLSEPEWQSFPLLRVPVMPYSCMPRLLAAADVVAIPQLDSETAQFQMPMKAYDCMAMGRPIVASAVSDLPLVLEGCARLVPPGDPDQLTAAIDGLLQDPKQARALGDQARTQCLAKFTMNHVAAILRTVVGEVLSGTRCC